MNQNTGKYLILIGGILILIGVIIFFFSNKFNWFGKLPGDIYYQNKNFSFSFPIVTMLIISLLLNLVLYIIRKYF